MYLNSFANQAGSAGVVLAVDDTPGNLVVLEALLAPLGYEVLTASSGAEGLRLVADRTPDVMLLDVMMPNMDGLEVCRRMKADPATALVPIVLVTSLDARDYRLSGLQAGADEFLSKPLDESELIVRLKSLVTRSRLQQQLHTTEAVLATIASAIELKDGTTGHHCQRLADSATALGRWLGLPQPDQEILRWAGQLHDVGKVGVPDAVLAKPGPLTADEWRLMQSHAELGERILQPLAGLEPVLPIVRHHHEWWDGGGYPDRLAGEDIPMLARVFQLVDAFDALTSTRPYKPAYPADQALAIMDSESGRRFDPELLEEFVDAVSNGWIEADRTIVLTG